MDKLRNLLRKYNIEDSTLPTTEELSFAKMSSCVQDNAAAARKTERLLLLAKQGLLQLMPSFQALSDENKFSALQCYVIYCINHKRALLAKYGVAEEIAEIKVNVPLPEGSGNRFDGEGDVDVDGLCRAAFKLFNKQGLYDTLNEGRQKFYAWLVENHPKYVLVFLKNFSGSRMDISYEAAVPLL